MAVPVPAVVVGAAARDDVVITSDPADLRQLAAALDVTIRLELV